MAGQDIPPPVRGEPVEPQAARQARASKSSERTGEAKKAASGWLNVLIDYGPLAVFFAVYWLLAPSNKEDAAGVILAIIGSTGAFMLTAVVALVASKLVLGKISRMLLLSTILIVGFGSLTVILRDPFYVQVKPTVLYLFFGAVLLAGWLRGKALLQWLLEAAFEGLDEQGWLKLSRNWGYFFLFLAALNETLRHMLSFGDWLAAKLWVFMPLSFLFTFTQLPMLLRHGLMTAAEDEVVENPPPE